MKRLDELTKSAENNNGVIGSTEDKYQNPPAENSPNSSQYYVPVWQSEKQIKDVGVRAALQNDDIDKIATSIVDSFKLSLDSQEKIFQSKLNAFNEQKARLVRANAL